MNRRPVGKRVSQRLTDQRHEPSADVAVSKAYAENQPPVDPCEGVPQGRERRTTIDPQSILLLVSAAERQPIVAEYAEYVDGGGTWPVTRSREDAAFLEFLTPRLPDPSHALSLCRMERAMMEARSGAVRFVEPEYRATRVCTKREVQSRIEFAAWRCIESAITGAVATATWDHIERSTWDSVESAVWDGIERDARGRLEREAWQCVEESARNRIERGPHASLVWLHAEPEAVLRALHDTPREAPLPPVQEPGYPILLGPGVPNLCRAATAQEVAIWQSLPAEVTAPELVERLLAEGIVAYSQPD